MIAPSAPDGGARRKASAKRSAPPPCCSSTLLTSPDLSRVTRPDVQSLFARDTAGPAVATSASPHAGYANATLAGESVELLAERAIHWPGGHTLFVADVHLGKAAAFRAGGVAIPRGATAHDLARLDGLIERTRARRLVVLGDFLHAAAG